MHMNVVLAACVPCSLVPAAGCSTPRPEIRAVLRTDAGTPADPTRTAAILIEGSRFDIGAETLQRVRGLEPVDAICAIGKLNLADAQVLQRESTSRRFQVRHAVVSTGAPAALDWITLHDNLADLVVPMGEAEVVHDGRTRAEPEVRRVESGVRLRLTPSLVAQTVSLDVDLEVRSDPDPSREIDKNEAVLTSRGIPVPTPPSLHCRRRFDLRSGDVGVLVIREHGDARASIVEFTATPAAQK